MNSKSKKIKIENIGDEIYLVNGEVYTMPLIGSELSVGLLGLGVKTGKYERSTVHGFLGAPAFTSVNKPYEIVSYLV